jgi:hypothetical protein
MDSLRKIAACMLVARIASADVGAGSGSAAIEAVGQQPDHGWFDKRVSAASVAAVYGIAGTWAYFAWFDGAHTQAWSLETPSWQYEQPFALHGYAGGADKWGHAWANYALVRGTTELLAAGGWPKLQSSLVAGGIAETLFAMQETKDGYIWGFEIGDMAMDVLGAAFAVAMENLPQLDHLLDFRMSWVPSGDFRKLWSQHPWSRGDGVDFTQDYTGMTFQLAVHLAPLAEQSDALWWTQWVDLVGGFETRGYEPTQMPMTYYPYQAYYLGLGVNLQGIIDRARPGKLRTFGHGFTEVLALPYQTLKFGEARRTWDLGTPLQ